MLDRLRTLIRGHAEDAEAESAPTERGLGMARPYVPLYDYLDNRYADVVVMTFREMEDLLGFALPVSAKRDTRWWANDDLHNAAHANAWLLAKRSASPNLSAGSVSFERGYRPEALRT
jgi:hypothetical protein